MRAKYVRRMRYEAATYAYQMFKEGRIIPSRGCIFRPSTKVALAVNRDNMFLRTARDTFTDPEDACEVDMRGALFYGSSLRVVRTTDWQDWPWLRSVDIWGHIMATMVQLYEADVRADVYGMIPDTKEGRQYVADFHYGHPDHVYKMSFLLRHVIRRKGNLTLPRRWGNDVR